MKVVIKTFAIFVPFTILVFMWPIVSSLNPISDYDIQNPNITMWLINVTFYIGLLSYPAYAYVVLLDKSKPIHKSWYKSLWIRVSFILAGISCLIGIYYSYYMMIIFAIIGFIALIILVQQLYRYERAPQHKK